MSLKIKSRIFKISLTKLLLLALLTFESITVNGQIEIEKPEPKSVHTSLGSDQSEIFNYDIDIKIVDFPDNPHPEWLYYFSLQVNFTDHDEWSHGGFQLANVIEFQESDHLGVNWGGGSDWAGYGGIGRTNTPFKWEMNKWYRYRVWRLNKDEDGYWEWGFWIMDYQTEEDSFYGTVKTKSSFIKDAVVWIETGYGVECNTERADIEWRNPIFRSFIETKGIPTRGTASYNGTCEGAFNTNQDMISTAPLRWFQSTRSRRNIEDGMRMW